MLWSERIEKCKARWIGQPYKLDGKAYTIVDVDYNGIAHIDRPSKHNPTTAVARAELDRLIPGEAWTRKLTPPGFRHK